MRLRKPILCLATCMLAACGGEGEDASRTTSASGVVDVQSQPCALAERQKWALDQLDRWYLYPALIDRDVEPAAHDSLSGYVDALLEPARAAGVDRQFSFVTAIEDENDFFLRGKMTGYGVSLALSPSGGLFIRDRHEGSPADEAGLERGDQILAIGLDPLRLQSIIDLAKGGDQAVAAAMGDTREGTKRWLRIATAASAYENIVLLELEQASYTLLPVSPEFGVRIIGGTIGYLNLRTFIDPAGRPVRDAFEQFRNAGVDRLVIDLRYNRGGLVRIADYLGDLMGAGRANQVFSYTTFRPEQSVRNSTQFFQPQPQSIAPRKIAFITTADTASASEIVMNAMHPYVQDSAMVGLDTLGKPVGQVAIDNAACGDRFRIVAFATQNVRRQGDYFDGMSPLMPLHCIIGDDWQGAMGDADELMTATAIDWMEGRLARCDGEVAGMRTLQAARPSASQRYVAGSF